MPRGQGFYFIQVNLRMKANAAFVGAAGVVMLNAIAVIDGGFDVFTCYRCRRLEWFGKGVDRDDIDCVLTNKLCYLMFKVLLKRLISSIFRIS